MAFVGWVWRLVVAWSMTVAMSSRIAAWSTVLALTLTAAPRSAAPGDATQVVVSVGERTLTVADVERRLRMIPAFQLKQFGDTPEQIKKAYVEKVLVPELLYAAEAERRGIDKEPAVRDRLREIQRQALDVKLREDLTKGDAIGPDEVRRYYEENKERFNTPKRIRIWRILVQDEALAKRIIGSVQGSEGPKKWGDLARQHSLDRTTGMRDGNLGFVRPDGQTDTPRVRVDPALFVAADQVKDGEVVPQPVKEGGRYAVVWRRGSMPAVERSQQMEENSIRQILARKKLEDSVNTLIERLKKDSVSDVNPALLDYVDVDAMGDVGARQKPGVVPRHRTKKSPVPGRSERGLR